MIDRLQANLDLKMNDRLLANLDLKIIDRLQANLDLKMNDRLLANLDLKMIDRLQANLDLKMIDRLLNNLRRQAADLKRIAWPESFLKTIYSPGNFHHLLDRVCCCMQAGRNHHRELYEQPCFVFMYLSDNLILFLFGFSFFRD